jgi:sigma-54 dependent transcriptional regulator, acetoin dehydrogenase operon transcriptional activator AcoR
MHDSAVSPGAVLRRARRALEAGAELPRELPEKIRFSWIRSRMAAAPMDRIAVPHVADAVPASRLLRAARPVLDRFSQQLAGTHVCLVLADRDGRVAGRWAGDKAVLRSLARVSIEEGYVLAEELAGTNGVGTALEELAPIVIRGEEHYTAPLQGLVCAGVPIRHPLTRRVEGVLDLACPTSDANGLLLPAALDLCAQIEREMSMGTPERERVVFDAFVARNRSTSGALVALAEQYMVTNAAAADLFDIRDQARLWQQAVESLDSGRPVTRSLQLSSGSGITARCTPIMIGAQPAGTLIEVVTAPGLPRGGRPRRRETGGSAGSEHGSAARRFQRDLAEAALGSATRILLDGEPGSGRLDAARRIHALRHLETTLTVHSAGLAQVEGESAWLADLSRLLMDDSVTVVATDVELLGEPAQRCLTEILASGARSRLMLMTRQPDTHGPRYQPAEAMSEVIVRVPALRERREDIPDLAHSILQNAGSSAPVTRRAMVALTSYSWPGNITQLRRVLTDAARLSGGGEIRPEHLGPQIYATSGRPRSLTRMETAERDVIVQALRECSGNRVHAAALLGISRSTLYRRLREFKLEPNRTILLAALGCFAPPVTLTTAAFPWALGERHVVTVCHLRTVRPAPPGLALR